MNEPRDTAALGRADASCARWKRLSVIESDVYSKFEPNAASGEVKEEMADPGGAACLAPSEAKTRISSDVRNMDPRSVRIYLRGHARRQSEDLLSCRIKFRRQGDDA